jgi:hypothetical protein
MEKTFVELREKLNKKAVHKDSGSAVYTKSISGYMVVVKQNGPRAFGVFIDGDKLDNYPTKRDAITAAQKFIKQYKG